MVVASSLIAEVKATGADTTAAQLAAVSAASDASAVSLGTVVTASTALSRNMAELSAMTAEGAAAADVVAVSTDTMNAAMSAAIPTTAALDAQFAAMRARLVEVGVAADAEAVQMRANYVAHKALADAAGIAGKALAGLRDVMVTLIEIAAKVALVTGIIAVVLGGIAVAAAANFEQGLKRLVTGAGDVTDNMKQMGQAILHISADTGTATSSLLAAMYQIISANQRGALAENTLAVAAKGAIVEQANIVDVAKAVTTVMTDYVKWHINATQAMNGLTKAVSLGKLSLEEMSTALSPILPVAANVGIAFSGIAAAMSTMTNAGVPADRAATSLRFLMQSLEVPTKKATTAMTEMGLNTIAVGEEMKKSLPGALQMIYDAAKKAGPEGSVPFNRAVSDMIGGQRSLQAFLSLTGDHFKTYVADTKAVADAMDKSKTAVLGWDVAQSNFNVRLSEAWAAVKALFIAVGTQLLPVLGQALGFITPLVSKFADWVTSSQGLAGFINNITDAITKVFGPAKNANSAMAPLTDTFDRAKGVIKAVGTFLSPLADTFDRASGSMKTLKSNAQPMLDTFDRAKGVFKNVHEAINPLVPIFQALATAFEKLKNAAIAVYNFLVPIAQFIAKTLTPYIQQLGFIINTVLVPAWNAFVKAIQPYLPVLLLLAKVVGVILVAALILVSATLLLVVGAVLLVIGIFTALVAAILFASTWIHDKISWLVNTVVGFFKWLYQQLVGGSIIPQLINSIVSWFAQLPGRVLSAIASLASRLAGFFGGLASSAFNWGLHIIQNIASGILAGISAAIAAAQAIADAVKRILGHSKPTEGPLKDDDLWGAHFVDNFVKGILAGAPRVQAAMAQMLGSAGIGGGSLNLGISGSFSGPSGIASSFSGSPVIHVHVHNEGAPIYLDGRQLAEGIGPHLVRSIAVQTGWRKPT